MTRAIRFYDDQALACRAGLTLTAVPVTKHGVIFDSAEPWEAGDVNVFAATVMSLDDGRFRMYYYSHQRQPRTMRIMVAESADGFQWERPELGQYRHEGKSTNVLRIDGVYDGANTTQPSVVRLPDGRWRMYCWLHGQGRGLIRYIICESDDGLRWRALDLNRPAVFHPSDLEVGQAKWAAGLTQADPDACFDGQRVRDFLDAKRLRSNDATNVYYDAASGRFEMFSVWLLPNSPATGRQTPHDNAPGVLRVIHRRLSSDGLDWGDPELIIMPVPTDPMTQQFYYLSQHRDGDWRIGFLGNYHCWEQTMELEMCFSRDGRQWVRPLPVPFVPRGAVPEPDCTSVYATKALLPVADERWLLLYSGGNVLHNWTVPEGVTEPRRRIMGATWPRERFAGLTAARRTTGCALLKPFIQTGAELSLNATIRGQIRAELRDPIGGRLPGYELHSSIPVSGDGSSLVLRWGDDAQSSAPYRYDAVTLYLEVSDATVYAINA